MPTIYRVEHQLYGTGPWNAYQAAHLISVGYETDPWGDSLGAWYAFSDDPRGPRWYFSVTDHAVISTEGPQYSSKLGRGWYVGCTTMRDLRHWFGDDTLALGLDSRGYQLCTYDAPDVAQAERQALFDPTTARRLSTQSTLEIPL